jgi:hypothetical protein
MLFKPLKHSGFSVLPALEAPKELGILLTWHIYRRHYHHHHHHHCSCFLMKQRNLTSDDAKTGRCDEKRMRTGIWGTTGKVIR